MLLKIQLEDLLQIYSLNVEEINFLNFSDTDRFTLFVNGHETDPIIFSTTPATTAARITIGLQALPNIGNFAGCVSAGGTKYTVTMTVDNGDRKSVE